MSELVNWDEIDALPETEQNERVVRMKYCDIGSDVKYPARWWGQTRYANCATWESQSRAEWEASKAGQPESFYETLDRRERQRQSERIKVIAAGPPMGRNYQGCVADPGMIPSQAQPSGDEATSLLRRFVETAKCSRDGEDFRRKSDGILLEAANFLRAPTPQPEVAETVELQEPQRYEPNEKGYMQESANGFWVGHPFYVTLRTRLAEVEAQKREIEEVFGLPHDDDPFATAEWVNCGTFKPEAETVRDKRTVLEHERHLRKTAEQSLAAMTAELTKARAELERLKGEMGWISVKDRLPNNRSFKHNFLVRVKNDLSNSGGYLDIAAFGNYEYYSDDSGDDGLVEGFGWNREEDSHGGDYDTVIVALNSKVTHWMPLPPAPTAETEGGE